MRFHRHRWEPHPDFANFNDVAAGNGFPPVVRRCVKCGRVEDRAFAGTLRYSKSRGGLQPVTGNTPPNTYHLEKRG